VLGLFPSSTLAISGVTHNCLFNSHSARNGCRCTSPPDANVSKVGAVAL
jgi:hypothetical protein